MADPVGSSRSTTIDSQRSRVYDAEHFVHRVMDRAVDYPIVEVAGSRLTLPVERRFASLDSVAGYVDRVLLLPWIRHRWARASQPVSVRERAGHRSAHYERAGAVIAVPGTSSGDRWALRELVLLHELAHHLADDPALPAHGPAFVGRYLELVGGVIGAELELLLRITLSENGARSG